MKEEQKQAIEEATNRLSKAAHIPQENIKFYLHLFHKINAAEENSAFIIDGLKRLNRNQLKILQGAFELKWLTKQEAYILWQLWQYFMSKEGNRNKFSVKVLTDIITGNFDVEKPKAGRRLNPALEFVFFALREDSEAFSGEAHYREISQFIVSLNHPKWEDRYSEETLRIKKQNPFVANEALTLCKAYFDAKGEPFLPSPLPIDPKGHVKHILENLDVIPMPEPKPVGIDISLFKRMKRSKRSSP